MNFKVILFFAGFFVIHFSHGRVLENLTSNDNGSEKRELYFCVSFSLHSTSDYVIVTNATLGLGKWTKDRYSNEEIESPINKRCDGGMHTICCKEREHYKFGPTGTLKLSYHREKENYPFVLDIWWDIATFFYQTYGLYPERKVSHLHKNWIIFGFA